MKMIDSLSSYFVQKGMDFRIKLHAGGGVKGEDNHLDIGYQ
jgi:hypothetical protein